MLGRHRLGVRRTKRERERERERESDSQSNTQTPGQTAVHTVIDIERTGQTNRK